MNLLVITYWSFSDALVQTYTLPYVRIIKEQLSSESYIYLVTLEQDSFKLAEDKRKEVKRDLQAEGIIWEPFSYSPFGMKMMLRWNWILLKLFALLFQKRIHTIHTWCTPAGAIGYVLSKLSGKPLVLDSFEPHAEPMVEAGQWSKDSLAFKILFELEKRQAKHATHVIACVEKMREYAKDKYGVDLRSFYSKPACVDFSRFDIKRAKNESLLNELGLKNKVVCIYAGKFGGSYLKQEVFDFFKVCYDYWGDCFRALILSNHPKHEVANWMTQSALPNEVVVQHFVAHADVPDFMGLGDFGLVPFVPVPSKKFGSPIKTGEYMAMGLPIVITKEISDDSDLIQQHEIGPVLEELSTPEYLKAVEKINSLLNNHTRGELNCKIRNIALQHRSYWFAKETYCKLYG